MPMLPDTKQSLTTDKSGRDRFKRRGGGASGTKIPTSGAYQGPPTGAGVGAGAAGSYPLNDPRGMPSMRPDFSGFRGTPNSGVYGMDYNRGNFQGSPLDQAVQAFRQNAARRNVSQGGVFQGNMGRMGNFNAPGSPSPHSLGGVYQGQEAPITSNPDLRGFDRSGNRMFPGQRSENWQFGGQQPVTPMGFFQTPNMTPSPDFKPQNGRPGVNPGGGQQVGNPNDYFRVPSPWGFQLQGNVGDWMTRWGNPVGGWRTQSGLPASRGINDYMQNGQMQYGNTIRGNNFTNDLFRDASGVWHTTSGQGSMSWARQRGKNEWRAGGPTGGYVVLGANGEPVTWREKMNGGYGYVGGRGWSNQSLWGGNGWPGNPAPTYWVDPYYAGYRSDFYEQLVSWRV